MRALLQMTMETEDTTERLSAPTVPSWNFSPPTPISAALETQQQHHHTTGTDRPTRGMPPPKDHEFPIEPPESRGRVHLQPRKDPILISKPHPASAHEKAGSRPVRPTAPPSAWETKQSPRSDLGEEGARIWVARRQWRGDLGEERAGSRRWRSCPSPVSRIRDGEEGGSLLYGWSVGRRR